LLGFVSVLDHRVLFQQCLSMWLPQTHSQALSHVLSLVFVSSAEVACLCAFHHTTTEQIASSPNHFGIFDSINS